MKERWFTNRMLRLHETLRGRFEFHRRRTSLPEVAAQLFQTAPAQAQPCFAMRLISPIGIASRLRPISTDFTVPVVIISAIFEQADAER